MTRQELISNKSLMIQLGHILEGTIQTDENLADDVYAYRTAVSFIAYDTSKTLSVQQVMNAGNFLTTINFDPESRVNP